MDGWQHTAALTLVFVLAGTVKGVTGMGLPTVAVSLLGLWMAPAQAAALLLLPSLATNLAQCRGPHARRLLALLWPAWLALLACTLWLPGLGSVGGANAAISPQQLLGAVLVLYGLWGLWRPTPPRLPARPALLCALLSALCGALTGWVTAATAVFVMPLVPYLQALRLEKDAMVQALGLSFTLATLALALRLQGTGTTALLSPAAALALAAACAGLWLGARLRSRLSGPAFQRALFIVFIGLGAANLLRGA